MTVLLNSRAVACFTLSDLTDSHVLASPLPEAHFEAVVIVSTANTFTAGGTHDVGLQPDTTVYGKSLWKNSGSTAHF